MFFIVLFLLGMLLIGLLLSNMGLAFEDVALALVALLLLVVFGALTVWQIIANRKKKSMAVAAWAMHQTDKETFARTQTPPVTLSAPLQANDAAVPEPTPTPVTPPPPATPPADVQAEVQATVQAWAHAWSAGNAEAYLGMYSSLFKPAGTETRTQWERMRRERVTPAQQINIRLDDLKIDLSAEDQAEVRFVQHYAAKRFQDTSRKQLKLALENGHWKITSETVFSVLDHPVNSEQ